MGIFGAYDIRGIYGKNLTDEIALRIGKALGTLLKGKETVCVGIDTRPSSANLFDNLVSGLTSTGCDVVSIGVVPNPINYFFALKNKTYGCYVTASHNPVDWNGFKVFKPNGVSFTDEIKPFESTFNSGNFIKGKGELVEEKNAIKDYSTFLRSKIGKLKGKVVVDFLGGGGVTAGDAFKKVGLDVVPLHDKPDASLYGFHRLEPWGDLLKFAESAVKKEKADFGVAFDSDADRSVFIDSSGNFVDPSVMNAIFIEYILNKRKGENIVVTYDCATELEDFVKKFSGRLTWSRVGHSFIEQKVMDEKALFGGEQSSHFYFNIFYPFSDGILSTLYLSKILNDAGKTIDELASRIKFHPISKSYIDAKTDETKIRTVEKIRKEYPNALDIADGIKIILNSVEWVIIRTSQTLPEVNLCIEAKDEERLRELVEKYSRIIERKIGETDG